MCGISGVELAIIVAAAIVILGPDKLPEIMRVLGRLAGQARGLMSDIQKAGRVVDPDFPRREIERVVREEVLGPAEGATKRRPSARKKIRDEQAEARIDAIRRRREELRQAEADEVDGGARPTPDDATAGDASPTATAPDSNAPAGDTAGPPRPRPATDTVARDIRPAPAAEHRSGEEDADAG
ncbi:MAG: twin-arginine translocase TatA/TatE family subunit [Deltaproteobacteria bacterium]|nr:MAG: twin-arginine translocase TatA/TatE family subunit [Deltaproteobacteria bacterium]